MIYRDSRVQICKFTTQALTAFIGWQRGQVIRNTEGIKSVIVFGNVKMIYVLSICNYAVIYMCIKEYCEIIIIRMGEDI